MAGNDNVVERKYGSSGVDTHLADEDTAALPLEEIGAKALAILDSLLGGKKEADDVIAVRREDDEWVATVESIERRAVPDTQDIMGEYEVRMDLQGQLLDYKRIGLRRRCELQYQGDFE